MASGEAEERVKKLKSEKVEELIVYKVIVKRNHIRTMTIL